MVVDADSPHSNSVVLVSLNLFRCSSPFLQTLEADRQMLDFLLHLRRSILACFESHDLSRLHDSGDPTPSSMSTVDVWTSWIDQIGISSLKLDAAHPSAELLASLGSLLRLIDSLCVNLCQSLEESLSLFESSEYQSKLTTLIASMIAISSPHLTPSSLSIFDDRLLTTRGKTLVTEMIKTATSTPCYASYNDNSIQDSPLICLPEDCHLPSNTSSALKWTVRLNNVRL